MAGQLYRYIVSHERMGESGNWYKIRAEVEATSSRAAMNKSKQVFVQSNYQTKNWKAKRRESWSVIV